MEAEAEDVGAVTAQVAVVTASEVVVKVAVEV